jgi:hypothetical protein
MTNPNTSPVSGKGTRLWVPGFPNEDENVEAAEASVKKMFSRA